MRIYLHPVEFHSLHPPRNILIHLNLCHTSQLISSLLVNMPKFSTYFLSTVYCMSQPSRIHCWLTEVLFSLLYGFPQLNNIPTCSPCIFIFFFSLQLRVIVCIGLLFQVFHFNVKTAREGITQYCGLILLSLEMWKRYHPILWPITAILGNVEKISTSIVADYCCLWKCGEDITQYCGRLLLSSEMWRILGLQTRIIGQRRFIDCVRQLKLCILLGGVRHIFHFKTG